MRMKKTLVKWAVVIGSVLSLSACELTNVSMPDWFSSNQKSDVNESDAMEPESEIPSDGIVYRDSPSRQGEMADGEQKQAIWLTPKTLYRPGFTHKSLADYAEQLAMKLVSNARRLSPDSLVGVASFVELNRDLHSTSVAGNQLAELFLAEMQTFGVSVVDFKLAEGINVLPQGDLVFSRDAGDLADDLALDYILAGTLIRSEKGVRVNARIVSVRNRALVSSATLTIPHFIIDELAPRYLTTVTASD